MPFSYGRHLYIVVCTLTPYSIIQMSQRFVIFYEMHSLWSKRTTRWKQTKRQTFHLWNLVILIEDQPPDETLPGKKNDEDLSIHWNLMNELNFKFLMLTTEYFMSMDCRSIFLRGEKEKKMCRSAVISLRVLDIHELLLEINCSREYLNI